MSRAKAALVEQAKQCAKFVFPKAMCSVTWGTANPARWPAAAVVSPAWTALQRGLSRHSCLWPATRTSRGTPELSGKENWVLEHRHSPCPGVLPAWLWSMFGFGRSLGLAHDLLFRRVPWSPGSKLLGGYFLLFILDRGLVVTIPQRCSTRASAPRGYNVPRGGDTWSQKHTRKSKPICWIFIDVVSPPWATSWENLWAGKTCQYAGLIGLNVHLNIKPVWDPASHCTS